MSGYTNQCLSNNTYNILSSRSFLLSTSARSYNLFILSNTSTKHEVLKWQPPPTPIDLKNIVNANTCTETTFICVSISTIRIYGTDGISNKYIKIFEGHLHQKNPVNISKSAFYQMCQRRLYVHIPDLGKRT